MVHIDRAQPQELDEVRQVFREYAKWLGVDLSFQDFERELAELPGCYAPPRGRLLVARVEPGALLAGTVALRPLAGQSCEMKRLFVRDAYRRRGIGRMLVDAILTEARLIGYQQMRLDTLAHMHEAIALYTQSGFQTIPAYYHNPLPNVVYFERAL